MEGLPVDLDIASIYIQALLSVASPFILSQLNRSSQRYTVTTNRQYLSMILYLVITSRNWVADPDSYNRQSLNIPINQNPFWQPAWTGGS